MTETKGIVLGNGKILTIRKDKRKGDEEIDQFVSKHKNTPSWFFSWMTNRSSTRKSAKGGKRRTLRKKTDKRKTKKSNRK
jgi:hypothetical protein